MATRRKFLNTSLLGIVSVASSPIKAANAGVFNQPIVISTWEPNVKANRAAWQILSAGGSAFDAVIKGVQIPEADPEDQSVGYGGLPDRDGRVTLDSCVMNEKGQCGAVMCLEHIKHPVLVARLVLEKTPHVQLVGAGALSFALANGFVKENLLTEKSKAAWKDWRKKKAYDPMTSVNNLEETIQQKRNTQNGPYINHDTIGMIAIDQVGNASGACTTSGLAYKMQGRVGDSPIIGAGLFVDNEVGAATATGVGEEVVKVCGAHTIVEMMRQGRSPEEACKEAIRRIVKNNGSAAIEKQVGFIAVNKRGDYGAFSVTEGFTFAVKSQTEEKVYKAKSWF
jgi:N4-(beta-N-acetylglucosaminyl)-L-asparaginase